MIWIKRLIITLAVLCGVTVLFGWLLLASPLFSDLRRSFVEDTLSRQLNQTVEINGDIRIEPGRVLHITADGLALPSPSMPSVTLAEIDHLGFDVNLQDLINGAVHLFNLEIRGTQLTLITDENGLNSWQTQSSPDPKAKADKRSGTRPTDLITDRKLILTDTRVVYQSATNGLDLSLSLDELTLDRGTDVTPAQLTGGGNLNDQPFTLSGLFPKGDDFESTLAFDGLTITLNGTPSADGYAAGFEIAARAQIDELGQFLDVLKINRDLEGNGHVAAVLKHTPETTRIDDLDVLVALDGGQSVIVLGQVGELGNPADVSLVTRIRLYPEDAEPPATKVRRDLRLIAVDMEIHSVPGQIPQRKMVIETNGFVMDTAGEGPPPIEVSQISRTNEGKLRLGNVNLRIGPPDLPFVILDGIIEDALNLQGISAEGQISIPAAALIAPEGFQYAQALGGFTGLFHLNGNIDQLSLTDLDASTHDTDLWTLDVTGTVKNVLRFEDVALDAEVAVPSGADLLEAMGLSPVDTGPAKLSVSLTSNGPDWDGRIGIFVDESHLSISADLDDLTSRPEVRGVIESDLIQMSELRDITAAALQLRKIGQIETPEADPEAPAGPMRDVTLLPLGRAVLLTDADMEVTLDLRHIEGAKGVSKVQSQLSLRDKELKAGPLKFAYGGGHFDVSGAMDLTDTDHILNLKGSAGGWQLANLLGSLNFEKGASGTLSAVFDVSGPTSSVKDFANALSGNATVSMKGGSIDTQLLDVAGLGVMPWLFSKDKKKTAPIVCLRAPVHLSNGQITSKSTVVETDQVQVVAYGGVNLQARTIDVHLQPRKIGEPLSRSPWPVSLSGSLNKPKIKVKDGPKKLKRSDGADQMPAQRKYCVPDILQLQ